MSDGGSVAVSPHSSNIVFCVGNLYYDTRYNFVVSRTSDGVNWARDTIFAATNGWAVAFDPTDSMRVYIAGDSAYSHPALYITTNLGQSWASSRAGLVGKLWAIAAATDGQTIYAGSNNGVFKSTNRGASWSATPLTVQTRAIAIDPARPNTVYAGTYGSGVHVTTNGGATWTAMNEGLTNNKILSLAMRPGSEPVLLAGTDGGAVFRTDLMTAVAEPPFPTRHGSSLTVGPSPTRGRALLQFTLGAPAQVSAALFDHTGRRAADLGERALPAGRNSWRFETKGLPAGTYMVRVTAGRESWTARFTLVE